MAQQATFCDSRCNDNDAQREGILKHARF